MENETHIFNSPVGHHLKTTGTDRVDDFGTLFDVGNLELLLQEDRGLLV
jgi:hypothetical protein